MLRCVVVDDEPLAVKMLENFISRTDFLTLEGSWNDPVEALAKIGELRPDLVFLDIQMPDLDGLELAAMLPEGTKVIFTTAFKEYAFESYGVSAIDFLLKPIRYQKFLEASEKARSWFEMKVAAESSSKMEEDGFVFIKTDGKLVKLFFKEVLYVEGMKDYVVFNLQDGRKMVTHLTMKAAEDMLAKSSFMRIHRSYIVNLAKIDSVTTTGEVIMGNKLIHVSEAYSEAFGAFMKTRTAVRQ